MRSQCKHRARFQVINSLAIVLILLFCCSTPALAIFPLPHREGLHKEIEGLELEWRQALLDDEIAPVEGLLADDYLGISANGTLETKADVLAALRSGKLKITRMDLSDIKIRIYGNTAVVTSKAELDGRSGDHDISGHYRYTRVYSYRGGQWKIVSFEASRISGPKEIRE